MPTKPTSKLKMAPTRKARARPQRNQALGLEAVKYEQDRDDDDQGRDLLELGAEVGVGALADGLGDVLHLLGALVGLANLADEHEGVQQAADRDGEHDEERDTLDAGEGRRGIKEGKWLEGSGPARRRGHRGLGAEEGDEDREAEKDDEGYREAATACPLAACAARSDHIEPRLVWICIISAKKRKLG